MNLLFDDRAFVVETLQDELGNLFDNTDMGGAKKIADFVQFVNRGDLVFIGGNPIYHARSPVRFNGPPARIHTLLAER